MKKRRRKGIFLLPNLLTSMSLFCGFYSIIAAIDKKFIYASAAIFVAAIFDAMDGRVARMTGTSSKFGVEYDSLADVIAFGVAPGILAYLWGLKGYGRFGWLAACLYVACGALRLARFNVQVDNVQKKHFLGLPIPAAAATIAATVLFIMEIGEPLTQMKRFVMPFLMYALAFLMVSRVHYQSFKEMRFFREKPFEAVVIAVILLVIILIEPSIVLFVMAMGYMLSGPVYYLIKGRKAVSEDYHSREGLTRQDGRL
jgi:CDP-diacylglycerol--serine O-phosphatidyltransferase